MCLTKVLSNLTNNYTGTEEVSWSGASPSSSLVHFSADKLRVAMSAFWMFILGLVFGVNFGAIALGLCRTTVRQS